MNLIYILHKPMSTAINLKSLTDKKCMAAILYQ